MRREAHLDFLNGVVVHSSKSRITVVLLVHSDSSSWIFFSELPILVFDVLDKLLKRVFTHPAPVVYPSFFIILLEKTTPIRKNQVKKM